MVRPSGYCNPKDSTARLYPLAVGLVGRFTPLGSSVGIGPLGEVVLWPQFLAVAIVAALFLALALWRFRSVVAQTNRRFQDSRLGYRVLYRGPGSDSEASA